MPAISIIVPVYNVSEYLDRCFSSIISQTFTDFEVIVVNDGSTDDSGALCDKWAISDSRISVIHIDNGGVANARNLGISKSEGLYVYFIDPDDWIAPSTLEDNFKIAANHYDIVIFGYQKQTMAKGGWLNSDSKLLSASLNSAEEIKDNLVAVLKSGGRFSIWNKLFKKSLLTENNIQFPKFKRGQDIAFTLEVFKFCSSIITNPKIYYFQQAFYSLEKYNPEGVENHVYFADKFFNLFPDWMERKDNYQYFLKLVALWFFHVIPNMIVHNGKLTRTQQRQALHSIFQNKTMANYLERITLSEVSPPSLRAAFSVLKTKNAYLLYYVTKAKILVTDTIGTKFLKKSYNG